MFFLRRHRGDKADAAHRAMDRLRRALVAERAFAAAGITPADEPYAALVQHTIRLSVRDLDAVGLGEHARLVVATARKPYLRRAG
jgi:hypothetical protein